MNIQDEVTCYVLAHKHARTLGILAKQTDLDRSWFDMLPIEGKSYPIKPKGKRRSQNNG